MYSSITISLASISLNNIRLLLIIIIEVGIVNTNKIAGKHKFTLNKIKNNKKASEERCKCSRRSFYVTYSK